MKLNKYLKAVQAIQAKAANRPDIHMFEITTRHYIDGDNSIWVTTQLLDEEEFHYFTLYSFFDAEQNDAVISTLTAWMDGENEGEGAR